MNKQRFISFRTDQVKLIDVVKENPDNVGNIFNDLVAAYPELSKSEADLAEPTASSEPSASLEPTASTSNASKPFTKKKKPIAKDIKVKSKLLNSLKETRFSNYSSYSSNMSNQASCLKSLKKLDKVIAESTKRTIYFSVFQGEVINKLQQFTGEKMPKVKNSFTLAYSISHCNFLIKLWKLTQKYNKIMYSNLSLFFFKVNFKVICKICEEEPGLF